MDRWLNVNVLETIILSQQTLLQRNWQIKIKIDIHILCEVHTIVKLINVTTAYYCHFSVLLVGALKDVNRLYAYNKACAVAVRTLFITSPGCVLCKTESLWTFFRINIFVSNVHQQQQVNESFPPFPFVIYILFIYYVYVFFKWKDIMVSLLSTPPCFSPPLLPLYPLFYCFLLENKPASKGE